MSVVDLKQWNICFNWFKLFLVELKQLIYSLLVTKFAKAWNRLHVFMIHFITSRSSRPDVFCNKGVSRNFTKFTGKHLCQSPYLNKVAAANLWKKRLWHKCFPVNFVKFPTAPFLQNTSGRLLLSIISLNNHWW